MSQSQLLKVIEGLSTNMSRISTIVEESRDGSEELFRLINDVVGKLEDVQKSKNTVSQISIPLDVIKLIDDDGPGAANNPDEYLRGLVAALSDRAKYEQMKVEGLKIMKEGLINGASTSSS